MHAAPSPRWIRSALLLGLLTLLFYLPLFWRSLALVQLNANEGWNVARAVMAAHGVPLYGHPPGLSFTNYPFLSFHLIAWLMGWGADPLFAGRVLAVLSVLVLGGIVAGLLRGFTPDWSARLFAGGLFALWLAVWMPNRIAVDDPQLLAMVFEAAGFWLFVRHQGRDGLWLSAVLFVLALFTKQNLVALPCGAGLALLCQKRWRDLLHWLAAGAVSGGLLLLLTYRVDGPYFFANMLAPRAYLWRDALSQNGDYLLVFLPVLCLAGGWCWRHRQQPDTWPFSLAWLAANALGLIFSGGDGVGRNVFFEAVLLSAVLAMAFCLERRGAWRDLLLLFPLVWAPQHFITALRADFALPLAQADFAAGVDFLKPLRGPVVCENLLLCARAGHRSAFETYFVQSQISIGRLPERAILPLLTQRRLRAVEIGITNKPEPLNRAQFTPAFLAALRQDYRPALQTATVSIWVPKP